MCLRVSSRYWQNTHFEFMFRFKLRILSLFLSCHASRPNVRMYISALHNRTTLPYLSHTMYKLSTNHVLFVENFGLYCSSWSFHKEMFSSCTIIDFWMVITSSILLNSVVRCLLLLCPWSTSCTIASAAIFISMYFWSPQISHNLPLAT